MRIDVSQFFSVKDSFYAKLYGRWNTDTLSDLLDQVEAKHPNYLILDPTEAVVPNGVTVPVEEASEIRRHLLDRIIAIMLDNPDMLYIVINRNDNSALKTAVTLYEAHGIADRYIFTRSEGETLAIIRKHRKLLINS
ncbi:MAG: hypothetical protein AAF846_28065 [Chloroflexota bacterium]